MQMKIILALSLAFSAIGAYAGEEKIPWGEPDHDLGFKYFQETSPDLEGTWDELEGKEQGERLSEVREVSEKRYEEVAEYYQILARKWDVEELREYGNGISQGDMKAVQIWMGEHKAWKLKKKIEVIGEITQKAEKDGLADDEALALEPHLQPEAIAALKHTKFAKELVLNKTAPRDYLAGGRSVSGLGTFAGKPGGLTGGKDLSKFYDGSKLGGGAPAGPGGAGPAEIGGSKVLTSDAHGTIASTIKHTAPGSLAVDGEDAAEPPPPVKMGKGRGLTEDEIANARSMYGDKIDYSKVRVITGGDMTFWGKILTHKGDAVVWGNTIYFPNDKEKNTMYSQDRDSGWLVHEMGHVYQYQEHGWSYVPRSAWDQVTKGKDAYKYEIKPGKDFSKYGIEQQADIVRDYYDYNIPEEKRPEVEKMLREEGLLGGPGGG